MDGNEIGIIVAAIGVFIGVVLEGWEHWDDFQKKGWRPVLPKIGFGLLVTALAVEIVFDARLAKESANTHLETARIEKEYGPRKLTSHQVVALAMRAQAFAGESAAFSFPAGDEESAMFANQIAGTLKRGAGWKIGGGSFLVGMAVGLKISSSPDERSRKAAEAIASELTKDGFPVPAPTLEPNTKDSNKLWITIGAKPLPEVPIAVRRRVPSIIPHAPPTPLPFSLLHGRLQQPKFSLFPRRSTP